MSCYLHRGAAFAVEVLKPRNGFPLVLDHQFKRLSCDVKRPHNIRIEHDLSPARNRAHSQFFLAGRTQLAHDENVQRKAACLCNFVSDGHTPAHQPQDNAILESG